MKRCLAALLAATLCTVTLAAPQGGIPMLKPEEFALLPWGWTPDDEAQMEGIRECGFNLAGFVTEKTLDTCQKVGLKAIVSTPTMHAGDAECELSQEEVDSRVQAVTERVKTHPALYGYYLRDEPSARVYPGLARFVDALRRFDPDHLPYINLFPNYCDLPRLGTSTYEEYLDRVVTDVKMPFVSYDHYAMMEGNQLRNGYFQNLEDARRVSLRHGVPFWNIVLGNAHFNYAEPSPATIRFQTFTTLAYGARGLSFFTYFAPDVGNYRLAPVDQFGHRTPTWDMMRNVLWQVHRLGPAYLKLRSVNVFHHPNVPEGCSGIDSAKVVQSVTGGDLLFGEFEGGNGRQAVIVVNKSLTQSTLFHIKLKKAGTLHLVNPYTGQEVIWGGENNWLAPGQGMLLFVD